MTATAEQPEPVFHCPLWPVCGCPDGAVRPDCPGLQDPRNPPPHHYEPPQHAA